MAGIALVLVVLAAATVFLYRGIDGKWSHASFAE